MTFQYNIQKDLNINIISLDGELIDKTQAAGLVQSIDELIDQKELKFVFNLSALKYINSSGLNVLINILTKSRKAGGDVIIINISKKVNDLFVMTKLNTVFTITDSLDKAIARLK